MNDANIREAPEHEKEYYLRHHAVFKKEGNISKIRVVFDASMKSEASKSLNDVLVVDPTIQRDLFDIMTHFRQHNNVKSADIVKMYRQVNIAQEQQKYQKVLWRFEPTESIKTYQRKTLTYAQASSAFLAIRALHQVAAEAQEQHLATAEFIRRDFYVDDLMTGTESLYEALDLKKEVTQMLDTAKLEPGKWQSNE